jgi:hypothetical protein
VSYSLALEILINSFEGVIVNEQASPFSREPSLIRQVVALNAIGQLRTNAHHACVGWKLVSKQKRLFNLPFRGHSMAELLEIELFWDWHYPGRQISFTDPVLGVDGAFWISTR